MLEEFYSYLEHELQTTVHKQLHFWLIQWMNNHNKPLYSRITLRRILINNSLRSDGTFLYCAVRVIRNKSKGTLFHKRNDPVTLFALLFARNNLFRSRVTCRYNKLSISNTSNTLHNVFMSFPNSPCNADPLLVSRLSKFFKDWFFSLGLI